MHIDSAKLLQDLVMAASRVVRFDDLVDGPMRLIERLTDASGAMLYRYRRARHLDVLGGGLAEVFDGYGGEHYGSDPYHEVARELAPAPRVVPASRAVDRRALDASLAHADVYGAHDLASITCVWLTHRPYASEGMTGLLLSRSRRQDAFDDEPLRVIEAALPALSAAVARCELVEPLIDASRGLEAAIEVLADQPTLLVDGRGELVWRSNQAARALGATDELPGAIRDEARRLCQSWRDGERAEQLRFVFSVVLPDGAPARAHLHLVVPPERDTPLTVVRLEPLEDAAAMRWDRHRVGRDHELTPTESEVLHQIALGLSNREIAGRLGISVETVRTHVKRVLRKLGVNSRVQAALVVWSDQCDSE